MRRPLIRLPVPVLALVAICATALPLGATTPPGAIAWQPWSETVFAQAARERRFVLLDLEAVWCHWCHVMDQKTYADPQVAQLIARHYIAVKVDQDARPDLSKRYQEYGWPATIVFAPDGTEIVKRAGYIPPEPMARLLKAIVADPSPEGVTRQAEGDLAAPAGVLSPPLRAELEDHHRSHYDTERGGLPTLLKFLNRNSIEYAMWRASRGDVEEAKRARQTLDATLALRDPVWGGFYQYSTHGDWAHPHYEKIMAVQGGYLRAYALAYGLWREPRYLDAAKDTVRYLDAFLTSPEGAYYTSQDADLVPGEHSEAYFALDDMARRAQGLPRVDRNRYARENGWTIEALATLYEVTQDAGYLERARRAAAWVQSERALPGGGFRHDAIDAAGPYLGDTLAMGRAYLHLYRITGERAWLARSREAADFMVENFRAPDAGMLTAISDASPVPATPDIQENLAFARFANLLYHYTGEPAYRELALHSARYIMSEQVARWRFTRSGILLLDDELSKDPLHLTVRGSKTDPAAARLFAAALQTPGWYKRVEWWDDAEGPLPNPDVQYPRLQRAAVFVCTDKRCSLPLFSGAELVGMLAELGRG